MRELIQRILKSARNKNIQLAVGLHCAGNTRKALNIGRLVQDPLMMEAAMANVIGDHLIVETLMRTDVVARNAILRVELKLGRKLSRERAKALLANLARIRAATPPKTAEILYPAAFHLKAA